MFCGVTDLPPGRAAGGPDLFAAVGRHFLLFVLPILVLAGAGVGYGMLRQAQYTAETKVSIGQLALTTQGVPGYLTAAANLAAAYARTVDAPPVAAAAAEVAGISRGEAQAALSSSAVPNTPLFRIEATYTDEQDAIEMANAATDAMILHVLNLNRRANTRGEVLAKYRRAALKASELRLAVSRNPRSVDLRGRLAVATLRQNALKNIYYQSAFGEVTQNLLQVIVRADHASSDRAEELGKWALVGGLLGLLIGLALVAGRASSEARSTAV